ncbi:MAG: UvrD-helicase domain-containing protein [Brachybacterium tyrofermentans]|uniref:UvrD-helicase domain-containing protein n=1 Tax=Brachybacterium tyrofermentans TaxID=47848 RepID=UPI003F9359FA
MSDGIISISESFLGSIPRELAGQVSATLNMLRSTPESPGLHVEPIQKAKDARIRSIRVTKQYRILAFRLNSSGQDLWLVEGVYDHDNAYRRARTLYLRVNPISGTTEIRTDEESLRAGHGRYSESEVQARAAAEAARQIAEYQQREAEEKASSELEASERTAASGPGEPGSSVPVDAQQPSSSPDPSPGEPILTVTVQELVDDLGIDLSLAEQAVAADETTLLELAAAAPSWQGSALLDLATGETLEVVRSAYFTGTSGGSAADTPSDTPTLFDSLTSEQSRASYRLIQDDAALEKILASGDFAEWRVFLHPQQLTYVNVRTRGPYRLTGGAGTGKTVVLVHRAVRLAREAAEAGSAARIVLTTYTRNLAASLEDQVRSLEPDALRADALGREGIHVSGVDRMTHDVVNSARGLESIMRGVLGWGSASPKYSRAARDWNDAVSTVRAAGKIRDADQPHVSPNFLADEYREVILPHRVTDEASYLRVPRGGRGTRLGRNQRRETWAVVAAYREAGSRIATLDWDETSAVAAAVLDHHAEETGRRPADHVLVDEGQDLRPTQWQFLRALVAEGGDDMFIAEDSHQRIYSNPVKLGRYGINIRGRSRRLRLNYRTTAQNLDFALSVLRGGQFDIAAMEDETAENGEGVTHGGETGRFRSARSGPDVMLIPAKNLGEEFEKVAQLLREWTEEMQAQGEDISTIGLLTRWGSTRDLLVRALDERGVPVASVDRNVTYRRRTPMAMTFHRAKGMEFSRVVLFGVDAKSVRILTEDVAYDEQAREAAELQERSLMYVGASRARDQLAVSWSGAPSGYLRTETM